MIKHKKPICKGRGRAKGFGCGKTGPIAINNNESNQKLGLLQYPCKCYQNWLVASEEGQKILAKSIKSGKRNFRIKNNKKIKQEKKEFREAKRALNEKGAMRLADTYFSRYIRLINADKEGNCTCYTCGTVKPIKEVDNGHYQKREHKATRYHENNCRPQCKTCNGDTKHNGKQDEFRVNLSNEIGEENVVNIEKLARTIIKANSLFYREIADIYREKVNTLQKELKVKYW